MTLSRNKSSNQSHHNASHLTSKDLNSSINTNFQECADCSSSNATWASINHGVLICDECCLAHRSLGRCISIVKSLRKSYWPQSLIDTLYELVRSNANQIWESNMSNEGQSIKQLTIKSSKKNQAKDMKMNYIKNKYESLAYISRGKYTSIEELNQQLLASVKTNNFAQTLRILSQGADANYKSQEDGHMCLHAATLHNQIGQIELLCLYGGDVTCLDKNGNSPYDLARANNLSAIADRLIELQFELTDELTYFLCNKRADHKSGEHFLIPDLADQFVALGDRGYNFKLQELPDHLFEELSKDIYDEMDRRQIETIWKCTVPSNLANEPIPFLIIKSCFTQTRNQLRQKLARFNSAEFSMLLIEIISESKRRFYQYDTKSEQTLLKNVLKEDLEDPLDEDDPLYDRVPSDEDYASVASESSVATPLESKKKSKVFKFTENTTPLGLSENATSPQHSKSNKATPSPASKTKVLRTNFDKPNFNSAVTTIPGHPSSASLVANAESALNSIMNSLNQIDYSHLAGEQQVSPKSQGDIYSRDRLNHVNEESKTNINELKEENSLMQAMIERLMEENAQLRAEKMITAQQPPSVTNNFSQNINNLFYTPGDPDEINMYSTVKNKKFNQLKDHIANTNVHTLKLNSYQEQEIDFMRGPSVNEQSGYRSQAHSKKVYLTIDNASDTSSCDLNLGAKSGRSNISFNSENLLENLKIVEENNDEKSSNQRENHSPSKTSYINAKQQLLIKQERTNNKTNIKTSLDLKINQMQHLKLSPSKSLTLSGGSSPTHAKLNQNQSHPELNMINPSSKPMPTKDLVIRKMKKITKAVQELFKATKESDFGLLRTLCEKVNRSVKEMILLFPQNLSSQPIQENLTKLIENSNSLMNLIMRYNFEIDSFTSPDYEEDLRAGEEFIKTAHKTALSNSSSSSSAISSGSELPNNLQQHMKQHGVQESPMLKNMIVSNLVTYSYEIAFTVKRIVCIMGADSSS